MAIVTLLTDFGEADAYVGQMKGAILSVSPSATLVDLAHAISPQDVRAGAFLLWTAVAAFPPGSIHVAVVDPGVGSARRAIAAQSARGDRLVGPDNGLLVPALEKLGGAIAVVELSNSQFWRPRVSKTFHGRDLFGPVAGHLDRGVELQALGEPVPELERPFSIPVPPAAGEALHGAVIHVDRFGTLITNLPGERLGADFVLVLNGRRILGHREAQYESVREGSLVGLVGSSGLVEIAVRNGSAAAILGLGVGAAVAAEPVERAGTR